MKHSFRYYGALVLLWTLFGFVPSAIAIILGASGPQAIATFWVCGLLVVIPVDKRIDATWRGTLPINATNKDKA